MVYRIQTHWITVSNRTPGRHWTNWRETCRCFPFLALRIHDNHAGYGDCNGILWGKWTVSEQSVYLVNQMRCFCVSILDCWRNFAFESSPLTLEWFWTCQQAFFLDDYSWSITHRWKQGNLWEYCQTGMFQLLPHALSFLFVWCCCLTYYCRIIRRVSQSTKHSERMESTWFQSMWVVQWSIRWLVHRFGAESTLLDARCIKSTTGVHRYAVEFVFAFAWFWYDMSADW